MITKVAPFVGRGRELERLRGLVGGGRIAVLIGEPGIGKTRTAQELAREARAAGAAVLWGSCYEGQWRPPFGPWAEAATQLVRELDTAALERRLGPSAPALAEIVSAVRDALPDLPAPAALAPEESRYRAYEAFARLLLEHEEPLVVVLDDLHWADGASLDLLRYVGRSVEASRIVVVGTYRDVEVDLEHPLTRALAELDRSVTLERVRLSRLDANEAGTLVEQLHGSPVKTDLVEQILRETEGNPFFIGEVVRHLLEGGEPDAIPDSVRQAVSIRVARLTPETRTLLALAAAFTGPFEFAVLQALSEQTEQALLDSLDDALKTRLVRAAGEGETYEFAHALVRDALYDELSPSRKARLHRRIAQALERVYAGREEEASEELASQYARSASLPGAEHGVRFAVAAADQARRAFAYEQAASFLRIARDLVGGADASRRAEILSRLAIAEAEGLMLDDAATSAQDALLALEESGADVDAVVRFLVDLTWTMQDGGATSEMLQPLVDHGMRLLGPRRDLMWAKLKLIEYPIEEIPFGEFVGARWRGFDKQAVAIARASGDERAYAKTLETMEFRSVEEAHDALAPVRSWTDPHARVHGLSVVMRSLTFHDGDFRKTLAATEEVFQLSRQFGSLSGQAYALVWEAFMTLYFGDFARARSAVLRAKELGRRLGTGHRVQFMAEWFEASIPDEHGEIDWHRVGVIGKQLCYPQAVFPWMRSLYAAKAAAAFAYAGEREEATSLVNAVVQLADHLDPWDIHYPGIVPASVETAWVLDDATHTEQLVRLTQRAVDARVPEFHGTSIDLTFARLAALRGEWEAAAESFDRARRALDEQGQRPLRAVVDYDEALARHRLGLSGGLPLLDAAERGFDELGLSWWLRQVRALRELVREPYPDGLTRREAEILGLVARGKPNQEIADELVLSVRTVERHVANAYRKIGARNRAEATAYAVRSGL